MGTLSQNFSRYEFICQCGCGFDTVDAELLRVLQSISDHFNNVPIEVSGPNRCSRHNQEIGGSPKSQHIKGKAADIKVEGIKPSAVYDYIDDKWPDRYGLGIYINRIHVDVRKVRSRWDMR